MFIIGLILMRLSGKQSIGELSTMDFVVITVLGNGFDTIIYGEQPIIAGVVYFAMFVLIHLLVSFLSSRSDVFFRLANSTATLMIHNGMVQTNGLQVERMRPEELAANMRERMEDRLENVKEAWIENNGKLSVVRKASSKPVQKQDLKPSG
jgi:uncharacterized membrane protein YcaP (DUF421 family)